MDHVRKVVPSPYIIIIIIVLTSGPLKRWPVFNCENDDLSVPSSPPYREAQAMSRSRTEVDLFPGCESSHASDRASVHL